ncbi:probable oligoribonuclease [Nylanderia fulva]|uniref:probable oligoribonuclease n=1 Tax=Nylanderia fulva TaxID=613905 RepID=UPI0010FB212F|nr:probable oligoribonuclease [Nylanderia fulva]
MSDRREISNNADHIVWIDMEMTGLDIEKDHILEIACIVTDKTLKVISEELNIIIHQSSTILDNMNAWSKKQHKISGLTEKSYLSTISLKDAEKMVLNFLQEYIPKGVCPLAGNSVYMDRFFLYKYMPLVNDYLHYRIIDVSTIKEIVRRWNPSVYKSVPKKELNHRALDDIKESIKELAHYQKYIFELKSDIGSSGSQTPSPSGDCVKYLDSNSPTDACLTSGV